VTDANIVTVLAVGYIATLIYTYALVKLLVTGKPIWTRREHENSEESNG